MWYLSFSDWLISLSIMPSRSIRTVAKGKISFFSTGTYSCEIVSNHGYNYKVVRSNLPYT